MKILRLAFGSRIAAFLLFFCFAGTPLAAQAARKVANKDLKTLQNWLDGHFDSADQAKADQRFENRLLHIAPVQVKGRKGFWLYLEESRANDTLKPLRQRICHLYKKDKFTLIADLYMLEHPEQYAGSWRQPQLLTDIREEQMKICTGCSIEFQRKAEGHFVGRSAKNSCPSGLAGAVFSSLELVLHPELLFLFERHWLADGNPAGSATGGYYYRRRVQP